ncbi:MAG: NAD(P)-dependent oxidoreductase [Pigmentiphaga sp.]
MKRMNIGVIGLGIMGSPIAGHLLAAGHSVQGYDIDAVARETASLLGVASTGTLREIIANSEVLLTSLPNAKALGSVLDVIEGLPRGASSPAVVIELSTFALAEKLAVRQRLEFANVAMLDCPISGTGAQARVADLTLYASGEENIFKRYQSLLADFSRDPRYVGIFGNGSKMKLVANLLVAIHNVATAEAMAMAIKAGLNAEQAIQALASGAGGSRIFSLRAPLMAAARYTPATMKLEVWDKDMQLIDDYARELGLDLPLFSSSRPLYREATRRNPLADTAAVFEILVDGSGPATAS